jgi:phosphoenolpyruvate-protein kinase (PTS system EI component)
MNDLDNEPLPHAMILGEVTSSGIARGRALLSGCTRQMAVPRRKIEKAEIQSEIERFDAAITACSA